MHTFTYVGMKELHVTLRSKRILSGCEELTSNNPASALCKSRRSSVTSGQFERKVDKTESYKTLSAWWNKRNPLLFQILIKIFCFVVRVILMRQLRNRMNLRAVTLIGSQWKGSHWKGFFELYETSKILWNNHNSSMKKKTPKIYSFRSKEILSLQASLNNLYWQLIWQISQLTAELQETLLIEVMFCMVKNVAV